MQTAMKILEECETPIKRVAGMWGPKALGDRGFMLLFVVIRLDDMEADQAFRIGRGFVALGNFELSDEHCGNDNC